MLQYLYINNYILIDNLNLKPSKTLNVITGETGAGKSILLGAIKLLMGYRYDGKSFLNKNKKCIIEANFDVSNYNLKSFFNNYELDYEDELIIRREISSKGKSRAFVNDTPVSISVLKILLSSLIDIHSQYDNLLIDDSDFQLDLIDIYANNIEIRKQYEKAFIEYESIKKEYNNLKQKAESSAKDLDYKQFLINELKEINLDTIDQKALESQIKVLDNSEFLKQSLNDITLLLDNDNISIIDQIKEGLNKLNNISDISPNYKTLYERLNSCNIEFVDILNDISLEESRIEVNPILLDELRGKLDILYGLQKKHKVQDIKSLEEIYFNLQKEIYDNDDIESKITELLELLNNKEKALLEIGEKLSNTRKGIIKSFIIEVETLLKDLDIKNAKLKINFEICKPYKKGIDNIEILFNANKGQKVSPIKNCASGGEISRLMFCFKFLISGKISLPIILFDEIDIGISGEIAIKMANMMRKMSFNHQIIVITHLPQIATSGDKHFFVYKDQNSEITVSNLKELTYKERKIEIAKMIGGNNPSKIAIQTAEEMLIKGVS